MKNPFPYLLMLFLIAAFFHAEFLLYVVYALLLAALLARWWARRALRSVTYTRRFESHVFLDDAIPVQIELRNTGRLPVTWLVVRESLPVELAGPLRVVHALTLGAGQRHTISYTLHGRRRGYYRLGPLRLLSGDLLGQEEYQAGRAEEDWLTVYPRIVPLEELGLPSLSPFGHLRSKERLYADPSRAAGVRDYAPGDSVRDIHWSASAASGALQVKTYEPAMSLPTALLLDLRLGGYDRWLGPVATELGVVVAASLAAALGGARQELALFTNGHDPLAPEQEQAGSVVGLALGKGQAHLVRALELLARVEAVNDPQAADLTAAARTRVPWGATLVMIGPAGDAAHHAALLSLRRAGFNVVRVVLGAHGGTPVGGTPVGGTPVGGTPVGGLPTYYVASPEDISTWRQAT